MDEQAWWCAEAIKQAMEMQRVVSEMNTVSMRIDEIESMAHRLVRENARLTKQVAIAKGCLEGRLISDDVGRFSKGKIEEALAKIKEVE